MIFFHLYLARTTRIHTNLPTELHFALVPSHIHYCKKSEIGHLIKTSPPNSSQPSSSQSNPFAEYCFELL